MQFIADEKHVSYNGCKKRRSRQSVKHRKNGSENHEHEFWHKHHVHALLRITFLFQDGIYLVLLMGLVEGYFVPLYSFFPTPSTFDQKVHNVSFSFTLMTDAGLPKPKARPEDLVNADLKSTLRVLYNLFTKYKDT